VPLAKSASGVKACKVVGGDALQVLVDGQKGRATKDYVVDVEPTIMKLPNIGTHDGNAAFHQSGR
jgi:hypothetical protein